jgi:predicted porin
MKKTLLAAALIAGYAGAASAQNSVTLYGVVSTGFKYESAKAGSNAETKSQFAMDQGQWNGNRWGLRGVEDLGNGLKASFQLESGYNATNGKQAQGGRLFGRQATIALEGSSWGKVQLGRAVSPGTVAFSGVDPFGASFGTSSYTSSASQSFIRYDNMVTYATPNIAGFNAIVGYSFEPGLSSNSFTESDKDYSPGFETNDKNRIASLGARYANGPILVSGIFDYIYSDNRNQGTGIVDNNTNVKAWQVGGSYDFKVAKVHAAYGQEIDGLVGAADGIANLLYGDSSDLGGNVLFARGVRAQSWMVGLTAPIGSGSLMASVQQLRPGGDLDLVGTANQTVASVGYKYNLSKRTGVYGYYSYAKNLNMIDGAKSNQIGVGVRHLF